MLLHVIDDRSRATSSIQLSTSRTLALSGTSGGGCTSALVRSRPRRGEVDLRAISRKPQSSIRRTPPRLGQPVGRSTRRAKKKKKKKATLLDGTGVANRWFQHRSDSQKIRTHTSNRRTWLFPCGCRSFSMQRLGPHRVPVLSLEGLALVMRAAHGLVSLRCRQPIMIEPIEKTCRMKSLGRCLTGSNKHGCKLHTKRRRPLHLQVLSEFAHSRYAIP